MCMYAVFPAVGGQRATSRSEQELLGRGQQHHLLERGRGLGKQPGSSWTRGHRVELGLGWGEAWLCESSWGAVAKVPAWGAWQETPPPTMSLSFVTWACL